MATRTQQISRLITKYHTLCGKLGLTDEQKRQRLSDNYGVLSSKDLYFEELQHICNALEDELTGHNKKMLTARNRVFGAVGGWLEIVWGKVDKNDKQKYNERIEKIKAIACRQTGHKDFNKIPIERLGNISFLFSKKQKDFKQGELMIEDELRSLASLN